MPSQKFLNNSVVELKYSTSWMDTSGEYNYCVVLETTPATTRDVVSHTLEKHMGMQDGNQYIIITDITQNYEENRFVLKFKDAVPYALFKMKYYAG